MRHKLMTGGGGGERGSAMLKWRISVDNLEMVHLLLANDFDK